MPRVKIQDIRRQELIEATIQSIYKRGFTDLTVGHISKEAGVSGGNIHYYFGGKNELLEATMRSLLTALRRVSVKRLASAATPRERLDALVLSNFDPELFRPETVAAWIQFWAQAPYSEKLHRLQKINRARVHSNLLHALKQIVPPENAEAAANMVQVVMDGIWLHSAQALDSITPENARGLAREGVAGTLQLYGSLSSRLGIASR